MVDAECQTDISRSGESAAARHDDVAVDAGVHEGIVIAVRGLDPQIEGALRLHCFETCLCYNPVEIFCVLFVIIHIHLLVQAAGHRQLNQGRCIHSAQHPGRHRQGRQQFFCAVCLISHSQIADALSRKGQGFTEGIGDDGVVVELRCERYLHVGIDQFPVRLVADQVNHRSEFFFLLLQDRRQLRHGFLGIDDTGRIVRIVDDHALCARCDQFLESVQIRLESGFRTLGHGHGLPVVISDIVRILQEVRRKCDDLILIIQDSTQHHIQRIGCAGFHDDIFCGIVGAFPAEALVQIVGNRLPGQVKSRIGHISVNHVGIFCIQNIDDRLLHRFRRIHIRVAQTEIVHVLRTYLRCQILPQFEHRPDCLVPLHVRRHMFRNHFL